MTKITIVGRRAFEFEGYTGYGYDGFGEDGKIYKFTSPRMHEIQEGEISFNPDRCEEIKLRVKIWDGKAKYQEDI